jgi:hypothetical protein
MYKDIDTCNCFFNWQYWGDEAKLMVLRSGRIAARRRHSCYSADKRHKQRLETMPDGGGNRQRGGYRWSIVRVDHFNSATLFTVAPH